MENATCKGKFGAPKAGARMRQTGPQQRPAQDRRGLSLAELDTILRYSAFGLMLWLAVLCFRDYRHLITGRLGGWAALCTAIYLHTTKAGVHFAALDLAPVLLPLSAAGPVLIWLFFLSQFQDHFEVTWLHKLVGFAKIATGVGAYYTWGEGPEGLNNVLFASTVAIGVALMLHLGWVIWQGRAEDLVEDRCRYRNLVSAVVVVVTIANLIGEPIAVNLGIEHQMMPVQSVAILAVAVFMHWQISTDSGTDLFVVAPAGRVPATMPEVCEARPEDGFDLKVLDRLMADKAYLEPGLTIKGLADQAGLPEHRLRRLINQHMGFRNFSDYLNHHRISAAKERLACVEERHLPVLTIAMDLGYLSLGPFNRAFKERTGQTPTEFRRQALADF